MDDINEAIDEIECKRPVEWSSAFSSSQNDLTKPVRDSGRTADSTESAKGQVAPPHVGNERGMRENHTHVCAVANWTSQKEARTARSVCSGNKGIASPRPGRTE